MAMIINEEVISGGEFLALKFGELGLGSLVGRTTGGQLVGTQVNPSLIDNGYISLPYFGYVNAEGHWQVENEGVHPDITVIQDPSLVNAGKDPQLLDTVDHLLERLSSINQAK